jgi:RNA polymerase sigma-70 factor (ECF subfamily)
MTTSNSGGGNDRPPATLGDLLYADPSKPRIAEADWVVLVEAVAKGNQYALHALYERTYRIVFTLIMRIVNDKQSAEEVTLDVFHEVWRRAGNYHAANGPVLGWIMNLSRSRAIDRLRFEQRKKRVDPEHERATAEDDVSGPDRALLLRDQSRVLRDALTTLTAEERQAIETAFFSELTHTEVAAQLKEPLGTIKTRIRSGLGKLRQRLGSEEKNE